MANQMDAAETNNWSDTTTVLDFERLLDFGVGVMGSADSAKAATKPLACARCHGQKLRCVRSKTSDGRVCDRCLSAGVECVNRQPQRIGRPADITMRNSRRGSRSNTNDYVSGRSTTARRRPRSTLASSASLSPTDMTLDNSNSTIFFEVDGWTWPSPSEPHNPMLVAPPATSDVAHGTSDSSYSPPAQAGTTGLTSYAGSLGSLGSLASLGPVGSPGGLLPSLEDLATLFPCGMDEDSFSAQQSPDVVEDAPLDDPVEHLSRLHLELYQCLVTVKSVEKLKKEKLRRLPGDSPTKNIDTNWSENLFRTTERFIEVLRVYVGTDDTMAAANPSPTVSSSDQGMEIDSRCSGSHVDTATGLLIVSCYTRLLQIFEIVVFVVETFKDMDCPGNYVQVRFGSFAPAANKSLQARILGQYVLHLLEGVSEAAERATASRQPYARAVAEVRRNEAKLKERILTTLH
ncbi:hypothetical protein QBC40DRAFT_65406 [Triangularia verruculosa]|uniref:Zn(2)-C6 fungal-type domain-containing protein n=1 Tax=Triangularia verruculosa TaxID=2587418 RepID=A0AAN7B1L7_9PEZI|nr:hypothetical protein QBC40DRAFT_65406 [Triangularia verruculosa]